LSPQKLTTFFSRRTQLRPKLTTQPLPPFFPPSKKFSKDFSLSLGVHLQLISPN